MPPSPEDRAAAVEFPAHATGIWRMIDANANRAGEGLRVIEDVLRLGLDEPHLTAAVKQLRHDLGSLLQSLAPSLRISSRDAVGDCGRQPLCDSEYQRNSLASVLAANWKRVQQALRSLEEGLKCVDPVAAQPCEVLRFATYPWEQACLSLLDHRAQLEAVRLCVLIDGHATLPKFVDLIAELRDAEVDLIQLRDKRLNDRELLARGEMLGEQLRDSPTQWIMNDRPDLAFAARAGGVHLGQEDLPLPAARRIVGPGAWIGISTHSRDQAAAALQAGATYIGVGPVFASTTKSFDRLAGLQLVQDIARMSRLPAFAIGGINLDNVAEVLAAGASRIAVGAAVTSAARPGQVVRALQAKLREVDLPKPHHPI